MQRTGNKSLNFKNIKPNKRLGQNFLIDKNVLAQIIEAADLPAGRQDLKPDDIILEIGPGTGILTIELAKRTKQVIAVEKDKKMCEVLQKTLNAENIKNVEIINGDILKMGDVARPYVGRATSYIIVANLPYYITSPVIRKFLETNNKPSQMILMIQKEVAQRICAKPPKMSLLSVSVQFYADPEIIAYVSKNAFYPVPKVDSAIIKIIPHKTPAIDTEKFFDLVRRGFSAKRKMLKNNLSTLLEASQINLEEIGLNPKCRAEELSINDWIKIYEST